MPITPSPSPDTTQTQDKPLILIVDDSKVMRMALRKILLHDFSVIEAQHGEAGWAQLLENPNIQMVFSDLSMPELDGFGLLARVRESAEAHIREMPFIVITGNEDDVGVREKALAAGATDFVGKPFQTVEITARAKSHAKQQDRLKEAAKEVEEHTTVDTVTQLLNGRHFLERAKENLSFAARQKTGVGLLRLTVDGFADVVAKRGEAKTQTVLVRVGELLRGHTRHEDLAAYLGDGGFAMLLQATDAAGARRAGERLLDEVQSISIDGEPAGITASIGALTPVVNPETDIEELMAAAERALESAVNNGGDCLMADDRGRMELVRHEHEEPARADAGGADAQGLAEELARARAELEQLRGGQNDVTEDLRSALEDAQAQLRDLAAELNAQTEARREAEERTTLLEAEVLEQRGQVEAEAEELRRELQELRTAHEQAKAQVQSETQARLEAEQAAAEVEHSVEEARLRMDSEMARLSLEVKKLQESLEHERVAREAAEKEACRMFPGLRRLVAKLLRRS